jgi:hypothetical protein
VHIIARADDTTADRLLNAVCYLSGRRQIRRSLSISFSRRQFLAAATAASLYAGPGPSLAALTGKPRIRDGVTQASATELARAIRDGSL